MFWALTFISLTGVVLNIKKIRHGFLLWMITNICWAVIDFKHGVPEQAFLFLVYFILSVWGWVSWSKGLETSKKSNV